MKENVIHTNGRITINADVSVKKRHVCEKDYIWNPARCSYENGKYLASIMDDSAITCDEVIESYDEKQKLFQQILMKSIRPLKINSVNPLYLIFSKVNGYFEEINGNNYLTLVPTNESKEEIKKYEELGSKIKDFIMSINDYYEKYMKIKFNSDDELPLNKTTEIHNVTIVVRAVFHNFS